MSLLGVGDLTIRYGDDVAVDGLSFSIETGEAVGLVGESGAGKSQAALALLGLLPTSADVTGSIRLDGAELVGAPEATLRSVRGRRIGIVFQDPSLALNPYLSVGRQLVLILESHGLADGPAARERAVDALARVGLPDPARNFSSYPHELSGGMRQRVTIAAALLGEPELLVADEPTTALDVTVQAEILALLDTVRDDMALLLITHDLGIVAGHCERMLVMDSGCLVESGPTSGLFRAPASARTRTMLDAAPTLDGDAPSAGEGEILLSTDGLGVSYRAERRRLAAVREASISLRAGETLAIVGESGSGKTSLARAVLGLVPASAGKVVLAGTTLEADLGRRKLGIRRELSLVFQDPVGSLSPAMTVREIVAEPLLIHERALDRAGRAAKAEALLDRVGIDASLFARFPHELSGGQAQRVAIARALVLEPSVLVCDEAVASLDGGVRRRILDLLESFQASTGLSILFIAHDLAVVRSIAHRVAVMYLGRVVEQGRTADVFGRPAHPYTRALLDAVPLPDPLAPGGVATLSGEVPSPLDPPAGCAFRPRCAWAEPGVCEAAVPALEPVAGEATGHRVACVRAGDIAAELLR